MNVAAGVDEAAAAILVRVPARSLVLDAGLGDLHVVEALRHTGCSVRSTPADDAPGAAVGPFDVVLGRWPEAQAGTGSETLRALPGLLAADGWALLMVARSEASPTPDLDAQLAEADLVVIERAPNVAGPDERGDELIMVAPRTSVAAASPPVLPGRDAHNRQLALEAELRRVRDGVVLPELAALRLESQDRREAAIQMLRELRESTRALIDAAGQDPACFPF